MKSVMFMIPNLGGGGAEKVLTDIVNKIDRNKIKVTLILLYKDGVNLSNVNSNIQMKYLTKKSKLFINVQKAFIKYIPRIYYKLKIREKYDVEIAFLEGATTKLISNSNNKKSKKIAWVHIDLLKKHWTKNMFFYGEEEKCYENIDDIIFVSEDSKNSFENLFKSVLSRKHIIYNPVIDDEIIIKSNKIDIQYDEFTIISVGRLTNQKGYDMLLKAHSKVVQDHRYKLVIVGQGEDRLKLEAIIKSLNIENSVILEGFKVNPYAYIKGADVFISSSRTEGYPLVLLESICLEKPIIATNVTGNKEILNNGEYGIMCEDNIESIELAIRSIFENPKLLEEYKNRSIKRKSQLDYKKIIKEIESLLEA